MKYFLILNPGSGSGKSREHFSLLQSALTASGISFETGTTEKLSDARELSVKANRAGYDAVVAVGGDGTINQVINGFYDNQGRLVSNAKFGVIYTGTSPDFCKSHGIPVNPKKALEALLAGNSRTIEICRIVLSDKPQPVSEIRFACQSPGFSTKYFACCADIGLGASLARHANSGARRILGDFAGTFYSLIRTLAAYRPSGYTYVLDGRERRIDNLFNLCVGKTFHVASGLKINSGLSGKDGRFYALAVCDIGIRTLPACLFTLYSGQKIVNSRVFSLEFGQKIDICNNMAGNEVEFDGDPAGYLPCSIETARDRLPIITGAGSV